VLPGVWTHEYNVHLSGKRFPVWEVARRWRKCSRVLKYAACRSHVLTSGGNRSKVKVAIQMRSMYDRGSEWRQNCADVKHLPAELARYIRDTYSEYLVAGKFPKIGGQALSWQQIVDLFFYHVNMQVTCQHAAPFPDGWVWVWVWDWVHTPPHTLLSFSPPSFHTISLSLAFTSV
jgi:hypothetical protein